jgi:hypothetical protein
MADEDPPPEPAVIPATARRSRSARPVPVCEAEERALAKLRHPSMRHRQLPATGDRQET